MFCIMVKQYFKGLGSCLFIQLILSVVLVVNERADLVLERLVSANATLHGRSIGTQAHCHVCD